MITSKFEKSFFTDFSEIPYFPISPFFRGAKACQQKQKTPLKAVETVNSYEKYWFSKLCKISYFYIFIFLNGIIEFQA